MAIKKATAKKAVAKKATPVKKSVAPVKEVVIKKAAPAKRALPVVKKAALKKAVPVKKTAPVVIEAAPAKVVVKAAAVKAKFTDVQKEVILELQNNAEAQLILSTKTGSGLSKNPTNEQHAIYKIVHTNTGKALLKLNLIKKFGKGNLIYGLTKKGSSVKF